VSNSPALVETLAFKELINSALRSVEGNQSGSGVLEDQHASQRTLDTCLSASALSAGSTSPSDGFDVPRGHGGQVEV